MRTIIITILTLSFAFLPTSSQGQNAQIDSLRQILQEDLPNPIRVDALNELALELGTFSLDTVKELTRQAISLATKIDYPAGIEKAQVAQGNAHFLVKNYDSAQYIFERLHTTANTNNNKSLQATVLYYMGRITYELGDPQKGINLINRSHTLREEAQDKEGVSKSLNILGNIYYTQGLYTQAMESYQKAMLIDLELNDKVGLSDRYNNIARIYSAKEDFEKALTFFKKSYDISAKLNDDEGKKIVANNIGYVLKMQGQYREALVYLKLALALQEEAPGVCGEVYPMYNIGSIYLQTNNLDSSNYFLQEAASRGHTCNDPYIQCLAFVDLGNLELRKNDFREAEAYFLHAYDTAYKYGLLPQAKDAAMALSNVYDKISRPQESLNFFRIYYNLYDSLYNAQNTERIARIEAEYEYEQRKQQDSLKRQLDQVEKEKELADVIWVRNSFIVGFVLLAIFSFLIIINYNRKNKANAQLNHLNRKISNQKEELQAQAEKLTNANKEITRMNQNLEQMVEDRTRVITEQNQKILEYVSYNSHQVRGPLARILGLVSLFEKNGIKENEMQEKLAEVRKEATELDIKVRQMNRTLEQTRKTIKDKK